MLCWLPLWIIVVLTRPRMMTNMPRSAQLLCTFFLTLSNTINPLIYAGMNPLFRKEFREILRCESGQSAHDITQTSNEILNAFSSRTEEKLVNNDNQSGATQENQGTELK